MNIGAIKRKLLVKYPFFGSVVANSNFIAESEVKKSGTDGKNIYYNPNFIETIKDEEQIFLFAHAICHIAFDHISKSEGKDKYLWNIATDSVVNAYLKQDGLPIIEGGVDIPEAINYDAEEMYKKLLEEKKKQQTNKQDNSQNQKNSQQQSSFGNGSSQEQDKQLQDQSCGRSDEDLHKEEKKQDVGHDTHSMWDKAIEKKHSEKQSQSNSRQSCDKDKDEKNLLNKMIDKKKEQQFDENQRKEQEKKLIELGEKEAFRLNKIERKKQLEELRKALASLSHGHGSNTNSERRNVTDIGISQPLMDWRRLLKEAVKYDVDWSYQNAGIEDGVVTAYLEEMPKPETEIVLDTSGSIDETLLRNFLRECKNIFQTSKVKVGCFDTKFYGFTEMKDVSDIDKLSFYGGGGTNFEVAVNAFTRRVENKIIFTDGIAKMPRTPMDAIWIVFGETKINPVGGKVIYIDDKQLNKLYEITNELKLKNKNTV